MQLQRGLSLWGVIQEAPGVKRLGTVEAQCKAGDRLGDTEKPSVGHVELGAQSGAWSTELLGGSGALN